MSPRSPQPSQDGSLLANLAAAPFVNKRPVQRFTLAAWAIGALLIAVNLFLWLQYRHDSTALRARLAETRSAIETRSRSVVEMDRELDGLHLAAQNAQVEFLNGRIAERTFPWSLLFERIATTLPDGVRLTTLSPVFKARNPNPARAAQQASSPVPEDELVDLKIAGVAKSDDQLYELIDAFFSSPAFERPRLYQESTSAAEVQFTVDVQYRPRFEVAPDSTSMGPPSPDPTPGDEPEASHRPAVATVPEDPAAEEDEVGG